MKKLNDFFEKHFIPFAVKLNNIKGLIAIRDAFIQIFPLTFVGSIAVCINCVVFNSTGFIGQLLISGINAKDYNVVQAVVVVSAIISIFANLLGDITTAIADPRVSFSSND